MKRRLLATLLLPILLLTACSKTPERRFSASFLDLFDTVTVIVGYAPDEEVFRAKIQPIYDGLREYHQLFDIYHDYPGISNLKTINDAAGAPVAADPKLLDLLCFSKEMYIKTNGSVNIALGSVLRIWHDYREAGIQDPEHAALPPLSMLSAAAEHSNIEDLLLDTAAGTVQLRDPLLQLDVGAIAKGYAAEQVCKAAPKGLLVSVGGNVRATGPRPDGSDWVVGIQDPNGTQNQYLHSVHAREGSIVSSGDYQRYYTVAGVRYCHIIDPATLFPADLYRAVTILCPDSGVADALSTALYTLPIADGKALLAEFAPAQAFWVLPDGSTDCTEGYESALIAK